MIYGHLRLIERCADNCHQQYYFERDSGEVSQILDPADCPINVRVAVQLAAGAIVAWEYAEAAFETAEVTDLRVLLTRPIYNESERENAERAVKISAAQIEEQLKTTAQGRWRVDVRTFVPVDEHQHRSLFGFNVGAHRAELSELYPNWEPTHYVGFGGFKSGINGEAIVGSNRAWIYGSGTPRTLPHEFGHCLGRGHANRPGHEYGDMSSLMGKGPSGWAALDLNAFGMIRHVEQIEMGDVFLAPLELSPACVYPGECQLAWINDQAGPIVMSTRKGYGQHFDGVGDPDILYIHRPDPPNSLNGYRSTLIAALRDGETYNGITHAGAYEGTVKAVVEITDGKDWPQINARQGIQPGPFVNRLWWDPRHDMQGLDLYWIGRTGQELVGWWYTHSVSGYQPRTPISVEDNGLRWYHLEGHVDNGILRVKVSRRTDRGTMETAGHGVIRFDAEDKAVFRFWLDDSGRDQLELEPLSRPREGDIAGIYDIGEHEGLTIGRYLRPEPDKPVTEWKRGVTGFYYSADGWTMLDGTESDLMTAYRARSKFKGVMPGELVHIGTASFVDDILTIGGVDYPARRIFR